MAMESFSRRYSWRPANGEGAMPRRDSGRIARDPGVYQRPFLVLTSERACSERRSIGRAFHDRVKVELVGAV